MSPDSSAHSHAQPVAVTGLGVIGASGNGVAAMDAAFDAGREGVRRLTLWQSELGAEFPVGQIDGDLRAMLADAIGPRLTKRLAKRLSRSDELALIATAEALGQAGLKQLPPGTGAYLGESVCGTFNTESMYERWKREAVAGEHRRPDLGGFVHEGANSLDRLADVFGFDGPTLNFMTACSSSANAIGMAAEEIRAGRAQVMLAGGADSLSRIAFYGFCSLKVTSPDGPRPFDANRQGMMVGEGAGVIVLESLAHARARGANVLAMLSGYGLSCDAHHLTAPDPAGAGAMRAMREALRQAGIAPADVGYINAHGTATLDNDRVESIAVSQVFGPSVPVSSTKRFFGHTLAAAGGIEAVIAVRALQRELLPANLGLREPLPDAPLDLVREPRPAPGLRHVLSNSFGFGGNNAALLFSRAGDNA